MDFMLLDLTRRYFHFPLCLLRFVTASALGAIISIGVFFLGLGMAGELFFVLVGMAAVTRTAFGKTTLTKHVKLTVALFVLSLLAGGLCNFFYYRIGLSFEALIVCMLLTYGCLAIFLWWFRKEKQEEPLYYQVVLQFMDKRAYVEGLMDTGNRLVTPIGKKPVIIVEKQAVSGWMEMAVETGRTILTIPFYSLGNADGILLGIIIDRMELKNSQGTSYVESPVLGLYENVLSREGRYQLLLHPKMRIGE